MNTVKPQGNKPLLSTYLHTEWTLLPELLRMNKAFYITLQYIAHFRITLMANRKCQINVDYFSNKELNSQSHG